MNIDGVMCLVTSDLGEINSINQYSINGITKWIKLQLRLHVTEKNYNRSSRALANRYITHLFLMLVVTRPLLAR